MTVKVVLEQGEDGWIVAHVPALRGCVSQGKTREEALANIREAIEGWLEVAGDLNEAGTPAAGTEVRVTANGSATLMVIAHS